MSASLAEDAHPLSAFRLDTLARGAARLRGERQALSEAGPGFSGDRLTYGDLDRLTSAFAARARDCGLAPGARVVVVAPGRIGAVVAVLGALTADLEPVVAPAHLGVGALAFLAQTSSAAAIFAPTRYGDLDLETIVLEAAAHAPDVRMLGSLGPDIADGAIDFSPTALAAAAPEQLRPSPGDRPPRVGFVLRPGERTPRATFIAQNALVGQALDVVAALQLTAGRPLISTLSVSSVAGLVAGPIAALLAGAPLALLGPFDAAALTALVDRHAPCALLVPAAAAPDLATSGLCAGLDRLALAGDGAFRGPAPCPLVALQTDAEGRLLIAA